MLNLPEWYVFAVGVTATYDYCSNQFCQDGTCLIYL